MAAFGKQIQQFQKDLRNRSELGGDPPNCLRAIMQVVIRLIILGAGFDTLFVVVDVQRQRRDHDCPYG